MRSPTPAPCKPSGVALALHEACAECIHAGTNQRTDPAVRLIAYKLASVLDVDRGLDVEEYTKLVEDCQLAS